MTTMTQISGRIVNRILVALICLASLFAAFPSIAAPNDLKLERVMLSTGGVGYFEYSAEVIGDAELRLRVPLDQVDDVLKSIVVYDAAGGVGQVRLPGREPLAQIFRDLPFGPLALKSPAKLLNHLQGAKIRATGARTLKGRVISVKAETITLPNRVGTTVHHRVSLITNQGVQQFILEQAEAVEFVDPVLRAQVREALEAIANHRVQDSRTLTIVTTGQARRTVRVGYVIAVPLWKASYRLSLKPVDQGGTARLRGWAHVDNLSGQDWNGVELTLVSGNPVTFRQALYTAYFVNRPEVPVEVLGRVLPRPDQGVIAYGDKDDQADGGRASNQEFRRQQRFAMERAARDELKEAAKSSVGALRSQIAGAATAPAATAARNRHNEPAAMIAATAEEAATQVVFRVAQPVTLSNGQSLMTPIADRIIPGTRLALYQPSTHALHPLATVRLKNDSESGLPPGSLTIYETTENGMATFLGDARISVLPAGDERLVSFALDQKLRIDLERKGKQRILKGRINKGIMELTYSEERTTLYRIKGPAREARHVLIEHPVRPGWKIITPNPEDVTLTKSHYRIRKDLEADSQATVEVTLRRPRLQTIQLITLTSQQLVAYAKNDELDPKLRRAITKIGDLRQAIDQRQRHLNNLTQSRKQIFEEQKRIRNNLGRVPSNSDLYRRYLKKLNVQEDELEGLNASLKATLSDLERAQDELTHYIAGLEI